MSTILGRGTVLIVDSDTERAAGIRAEASAFGYNCSVELTARAALRRVKTRAVNVIVASADLTDLHMDTFLESLSRANVDSSVVIYGKNISAAKAIDWMRAGAVDILLDPSDGEALRNALQSSFTRSSMKLVTRSSSSGSSARSEAQGGGMLYRSRAMTELMKTAARVAPVKATVLISGESGTGKDVLAREIHALSRRPGSYIAINCAAIPETLLESELFGHERGAFTGADTQRQGKFEAANCGTLLLDEIGDIPPAIQAKLLRVLEDETVTRLGGNRPIPVDVRVIAATNRDLREMVDNGGFREDLYYRLKVIELDIPPLRSRKSDIPLLTMALLRQSAEKHNLSMPEVEPEVLQRLKNYRWPGNVRQLRNMMESLLITCHEKITVDDLPPDFERVKEDSCSTMELCLPMELSDIEEEVIRRTLDLTGGNRTRTASLLGIGRRTLQRKLESYESEKN
ncbi:MAG TPA: sigma-54 dependent transcriptional regulator [Candidatus Sabulitectum sp.]|nr:sigma-54 dependent transcriptional regulator [Candidatus Sabulitectum sp.]HPJ27629.1 sigma-54 dependent transcriptional regulator [Candidatus Sabulitectum sp.]